LLRPDMKKLLGLLILFGLSQYAHAQHKTYAAIVLENDAFVGEDDGYTNGFGFVWSHGSFDKFNDSNTPSWIGALTEDLYISTMSNKRRAITYGVAQTMQTPEDIDTEQLLVDDLPYVGLLTWKATQYAFDEEITDSLSLALGVVGPLSFAEQTQKGFHKVIDADEPKGWDNQLDTEPVFRVAAARNFRLIDGLMTKQLEYDVIGLSEVGVGTISSEISAGMTIRVGRILTATFPVVSLIPGREVNPLVAVKKAYYFYIGGVVRYIGNDIMIDGNTFRDSHYLDLRHDQHVITAGFSMNIGDIAITLSYVDPSKQVVNQSETDPFGTLSIAWSF